MTTIIRTTEKDGFVWHEATDTNGNSLLHWSMLDLIRSIYSVWGIDLKPYMFNYKMN